MPLSIDRITPAMLPDRRGRSAPTEQRSARGSMVREAIKAAITGEGIRVRDVPIDGPVGPYTSYFYAVAKQYGYSATVRTQPTAPGRYDVYLRLTPLVTAKD